MNKKMAIIILLMLVLLIFIKINFKGNNNKNNNIENDNIYSLIPSKYFARFEEVCSNNINLYFSHNGINYYTYCMTHLEVVFEDTLLVRELKNAIDYNETTVDNIIAKANNKEYKNGIDIYHYENFKLINCNNKAFFIPLGANENDFCS